LTEKGSEKWTSDGYEILEEITRVPANEDAPIHLNGVKGIIKVKLLAIGSNWR